jgi:hypothetical protein
MSGFKLAFRIISQGMLFMLSFNDIHGVSEVIHEEPGFVRAKMEEMEMELSKHITRGKESYMQAEAQNKEYVTRHKFRLMFLRAEMFDARLAAGRMVRFFEEKKKLFGPEKLTKEIKLSDLDKDDQKFLNRGVAQILPQRDRAGRCIIIWMPMIRGESDPYREREETSWVRSSSCWTGVVVAIMPPCVRFSLKLASFTHSIFTTHREEDVDYVLSTDGC